MTAQEVVSASVRIAASPEDVFPYLINPDLLTQWLGEWADLEPTPGGIFAVDLSQTPVRGEYVEVDPPRRVVFTWGVPGRDHLPPGSTRVEIVLTANDGETLVELSHHGLPADEVDSHRQGWSEKLSSLVEVFS